MTETAFQALGLFGLGLTVGLLSSFFGLGGGVLIVPILPFLVEAKPVEVVWISLICIGFIVTVNVFGFQRQRLIDWPLVGRLGPIAVLGGVIAALSSSWVSGDFLRWTSGLLLLFLSFHTLSSALGNTFLDKVLTRALWPLTFFGGFASGLTGVGTGALLSPVLFQMRKSSPGQVSPSVNGVLLCSALTSLGVYLISRRSEVLAMNETHLGAIAWICFGAYLSARWGRPRQIGLSRRQRQIILASILFGLSCSVLTPLLVKWLP